MDFAWTFGGLHRPRKGRPRLGALPAAGAVSSGVRRKTRAAAGPMGAVMPPGGRYCSAGSCRHRRNPAPTRRRGDVRAPPRLPSVVSATPASPWGSDPSPAETSAPAPEPAATFPEVAARTALQGRAPNVSGSFSSATSPQFNMCRPETDWNSRRWSIHPGCARRPTERVRHVAVTTRRRRCASRLHLPIGVIDQRHPCRSNDYRDG